MYLYIYNEEKSKQDSFSKMYHAKDAYLPFPSSNSFVYNKVPAFERDVNDKASNASSLQASSHAKYNDTVPALVNNHSAHAKHDSDVDSFT